MRPIRDLTINNIVSAADEDPLAVVDLIQEIIDKEEFDIPEYGISKENIHRTDKLRAYYANQQAYLVGLYGVMHIAAATKEVLRIRVRDYLEKAISVCSRKYEAASRILSSYKQIQDETGMRDGWGS